MLLFDIGNSRCKWAWIEAEIWQRQGVFAKADEAAWQQLKLIFSSLPAPQIILFPDGRGWEWCRQWKSTRRKPLAGMVS